VSFSNRVVCTQHKKTASTFNFGNYLNLFLFLLLLFNHTFIVENMYAQIVGIQFGEKLNANLLNSFLFSSLFFFSQNTTNKQIQIQSADAANIYLPCIFAFV